MALHGTFLVNRKTLVMYQAESTALLRWCLDTFIYTTTKSQGKCSTHGARIKGGMDEDTTCEVKFKAGALTSSE